jgi:hypothetical protein
MYPTVPAVADDDVVAAAAVLPLASDSPKSDTLAVHSPSSRILDGFTSRWMMAGTA